jgi:hypothetical protein
MKRIQEIKLLPNPLKLALANKDIVGFKVDFVGPDWSPVDRGVEAGNIAKMPIMLDGGRNHPYPSLKDLFTKHMRPGDIYTHTYTIIEDINARDMIVDQQTSFDQTSLSGSPETRYNFRCWTWFCIQVFKCNPRYEGRVFS